MRISTSALGIALLAAASASTTYAGPEWTEMLSDSGSSIDEAHTPIGSGDLGTIVGELEGSGDFQDVFRIYVKDYNSFSAMVEMAPGSSGFDPQLWLFDENGVGILGNQDNLSAGVSGEAGFGGAANDGSGSQLTHEGVYYIAVSGSGSAPLDDSSSAIFSISVSTEISGPDGSNDAFSDAWSGIGTVGEYSIQFSGVKLFLIERACDFDLDGCVDSGDAATLNAKWGEPGISDLNNDGTTDTSDLAILISNWGCY